MNNKKPAKLIFLRNELIFFLNQRTENALKSTKKLTGIGKGKKPGSLIIRMSFDLGIHKKNTKCGKNETKQ